MEFDCRNVPEHPSRCTGLAPDPMGEMGHLETGLVIKAKGVHKNPPEAEMEG